MAKDVIIFDTTLRDGEQAPGNAMSPEAKLRLARQLDALGVDVIEAGFPAASQGDLRGVQQVADAVQRPIIAALARCHDGDIDRAAEALTRAARKRIHVFIATSDLHLEQKLRIDRATCVERVRAAVQRARGYAADVEFSAEDATRSDLDFLCRVVLVAIAEGATTINLPDTVGYTTPAEYAALFRAVRDRVLQNGLTYEIIAPETVGAGGSSIVLGKHSGRHALERRYRELGYEPDANAIEQLYQAFTALADKKRQILDEDLLTLLHDGFHRAPEVYNLTQLRVTCGTETATAEVRIAGPGFNERSATASGNGPIAAAFAAVGEAVGRTIEVLDLSVQSVTPGRDSLGRVLLQVRIDGKSLSGHGASTDIVEAGARALVHALNKADHADGLETAALSSSYYWGV